VNQLSRASAIDRIAHILAIQDMIRQPCGIPYAEKARSPQLFFNQNARTLKGSYP
jgi:hypothetical protein